MNDDDRVLEYVQGRLPPQQRSAFEKEMAQSAALHAEVTAMLTARDVLGRDPDDLPAGGWARLTDAIESERPAAANDNNPIRLSLLQVAAVAIAAVLGWQAVETTLLTSDPAGYVPASASVSGPAVQVQFTSTARLSDVSRLLADVDGSIVDGPGALGLYTITFEDVAARDAAFDILRERSDMTMNVTRY